MSGVYYQLSITSEIWLTYSELRFQFVISHSWTTWLIHIHCVVVTEYHSLQSVCLFVCLSAHVSHKPDVQISLNLPYLLPAVMTQSSFHVMYFSFVDDIMFSYNGGSGPKSKTKGMFFGVWQVAAPGQSCCLWLSACSNWQMSFVRSFVLKGRGPSYSEPQCWDLLNF